MKHSWFKALMALHAFQAPSDSEEGTSLKSPDGAALVRDAARAESQGLDILQRSLESI